MSEQSARRIALLLKTKDELESWLDTFHQETIDAPRHDFLRFGSIGGCASGDGSGPRTEWDSYMLLPIDIAIRMLSREIEAVFADLHALGVDLSTPEPDVAALEADQL